MEMFGSGGFGRLVFGSVWRSFYVYLRFVFVRGGDLRRLAGIYIMDYYIYRMRGIFKNWGFVSSLGVGGRN